VSRKTQLKLYLLLKPKVSVLQIARNIGTTIVRK